MDKPIKVVESTVEEAAEFSEWFLPMYRFGSGHWFVLCACQTKTDAEGNIRGNTQAPDTDWRIVRVLLPNR